MLPALTGPYPVGTLTFEWVDEDRPETLSANPSGPRRLMVQVWYPAAVTAGAQPGLYMNELEIGGAAVARKFGFPPFMLGHLGLARTHAYPAAALPAGSERYPVLVFSHGWQGFRMQNTYQVEELASHGYVVFAPDHTYGALVTTFPDGSSALNRPELLPSDGSDIEYARAARILGKAWTDDLRFVLDQAAKLNSGQLPGIFAGRLDLAHTGVFGHSTGGGAAVEVCYLDLRCKAGLAMDAWLVPYSSDVAREGLKVPFFFMQSEKWPNGPNASLLPALYDAMKAPAWRVTIAGARHYDFSDISLLTPLAPLIGIKGPIDSLHALNMIDAYTVAFFDAALLGKPSALLEAPSPAYTGARFEQK